MLDPISSWLPSDRMVWAYTTKGDFTVRSAYKLAISMCNDGESGEVSNAQGQKQFWRKLWRLQVPNKVRSFAWRASKNILPTKVNLCHRKVLDNPTCEACGAAAENGGYVFWDCIIAREAWKVTGISFDAHDLSFPEFVDFLWYLIYVKHFGDELLELILMVAWCLWFSRNESRQGRARIQSSALVQKARFLLEFQIANLKLSHSSPKEDITWIPPAPPRYKLNVNGATFSTTYSSGVGLVIRDSAGRVTAAMSMKIPCPLGPLESEAKAMEEGVSFAWDVGVREVLFECDSLIVTEALNGIGEDPATVSNIIDGIRLRMNDFRDTKVVHVRRQGNRLAHLLAQFAKNIDGYVTWMGKNPTIIESASLQDVLALSSF